MMAHPDALFNRKQYIGPESLADICFRLICSNLDIISSKDERGYRILRKGVALPSEICDKIIEFAHRNGTRDIDDYFLSMFKDSPTRLKRVKIANSSLSDESVLTITKHKLTELELSECKNLTELTIEHINANSDNLISLAFRGGSMIVPSQLKSEDDSALNYNKRGYVLRTPNLKKLALWNVDIAAYKYELLLAGLTNLTHLDLSNASHIGHVYYHNLVPNLVSLSLYNVKINSHPEAFVTNISYLKNLRDLDISQSHSKHGEFENPNKILGDLVCGLPKLVSLDIGGTNLAGRGVAERPDRSIQYCSELCDIPGLSFRVHTPLQFLGLYGTAHGACRRHDIPAQVIAGEGNEEQILVAARVCMDNKRDLLRKVLNDLYHIFRYENCERMDQALHTVLEAMEKHPTEKHIQISGSATLFYIVKIQEENGLPVEMKRRIIGTLLAGMSAHRDEETMMRNGCLALCQFRIPHDVMWNYEELVRVLLHSAENAEQEGFVQRIGLYLLNSLACQVDGRHKRLLGELGCVPTMLRLIEYRLEGGLFDDVLEVAWSTMWNMTDETPINCQRFLVAQGMRLFLGCVDAYPNKEELLRNMMGLLGNVAEVENLRPQLMEERFVAVFARLLNSDSDGIEVSYNAAGILAHMAADGREAWVVKNPDRDYVLSRMSTAIDRWDLSAARNINYRSFLPLLRLLDIFHTPQCQYWAIWALANLTKVYPDKYCILVEKEGGLTKLEKLLKDPRPNLRMKELAHSVLMHCQLACHPEQLQPSKLSSDDACNAEAL
ncbi:protein zer-1 homolog isoform X1 [Neodiprion pinetum]|uniref:Protein zer-1 homolog n=1 Tax=Neodiprion lecontei TaxID=441921 RepID=A0A6J0BI99_NEOLC|nr:protein zer-1 homolog isoform X1 [Neodiprion lecontei]XP_046467721.1 protein zer-1 homolog isoform X1 [Neodiprion pinetum]